MSDSYQTLIPLIKEKSDITDPQKFQRLVNVIFHDFEAAHYDELHSEMWQSLPYQYQLLVGDSMPYLENRGGLKLLDVGCGTGLATELLLQTSMGSAVSEIDLLDTSDKMLDEALKRSKKWKKKINTINGMVSDIEGSYDVIIISSVLHHIPDLVDFLKEVTRIQKPGGILITIHDPNSSSLESQVYINRTIEYDQHKSGKLFKKDPLNRRIINKVRRVLKLPTYIDKINEKLLQEHVITKPLNDSELWSITDIHVENLPYSIGRGISRELLVSTLKQYTQLSYRTYGFYGYLYSNLDDHYKEKETELSTQNDLYGRNFCSAWVKKPND